MAEILTFPGHRLHGTTASPCDRRKEDCFVCEGGLALCGVCGGAEACLPTDCPGYRMEPEVAEAVGAGEVDYDARVGWIRRDNALPWRRGYL